MSDAAPAATTPVPDAAPAAAADASSSQDQEQLCTQLIEQGRKALALQEWETAVEKYADALEIRRTLHGELSPLLAPLLLSYGKALFEVAVSQQGVMGKTESNAAEAAAEANEASSSKIRFEGEGVDVQESAAAEEDGDEEDGEGDGEGAAGGEDGDGDEPEDDFNEAWMVLDLARTLYEKQLVDEPAEKEQVIKKNLGDCRMLLGDVSLETENFPQAVEDYKSSLSIFSSVLPFSSREVASAHFKLGVVLESVADGRAEALENIQKAIESVEARKETIKEESERKECDELLQDLKNKLEDLRVAPPQQDFIEQSIAHLMGGDVASAVPASAQVNDLTSMVRKKKKTAEAPAAAAVKRPAEGEDEPDAKKAKQA